MANNETKFCDACHEREATCHTTTIVEGKQEVADLCSFCFEALGSPYAREMAAQMRNAKCDFCGAPANMGGTDSMALSVGVQRFQHLCFA